MMIPFQAKRKATVFLALLAVLSLSGGPLAAQECTPEDIVLTSQADVDDFQANHGPCDHVTGDLKIEGEDISSLAGLSALTGISKLDVLNCPLLNDLSGLTGLVHVSSLQVHLNPALTGLEGMTALDSIDSIYIAYNHSLTDLRGLESVQQLGTLTIRGNDSLQHLEGLSGLSRVGGNWLEISNNRSLETLDGLDSLHTIVGNLTIEDNNALRNIDGLSSLQSVAIDSTYSIRIQRNASLENLNGLSSLSRIEGALIIHLNDALVDLGGLSRIARIGAWLHIAANPSLTSLDGLESLTTVGSLGLINNARLSDISGLMNLQSVQFLFEISWNPVLKDLDGLNALTRVGASTSPMSGLLLRSNQSLANLDGLARVQAAGNLVAEDNPNLADCSAIARLIDPVDDHEPGPGPGTSGIPDIRDTARFGGNAGGCESVNGILGGIPLAEINPGLNDAWFDPEVPGQGFLITVFPEIGQLFLAWFTFDVERPPADVEAILGEPGHRWLTAQGDYSDNAAQLEINLTSGGVFDAPSPSPQTEPYGELLLEFSTCDAGTISYDMPAPGVQGIIPIQRITLDNVPLCYLLANPPEGNAGPEGTRRR